MPTPTPLQNYSCTWIETWRISWPWRRGHFGILHRRGILPFVRVHQQSKLMCLVCTQSPCIPRVAAAWWEDCCSVGMLRRRVDGPIFFFSKTLNSQWYCDNILYPFIVQVKEDEMDKAYLQQDGATAHRAHISMAVSDEASVDRIICKTIWPPRPPYLSPPDFFSWVRWKTQRIQTIPTQLMIWRWPSQNTFGMWTVLYWTRSSRTQFGV